MTRFFVKPTDIGSKHVNFNEQQSRKIRKVLRMKVGGEVIAFDGHGWEYHVKLSKITTDFSTGEIIEKKLIERGSYITAVQALPKNLKIEFILQKCSELGADRFVFFESEYSQVQAEKIRKEKVVRWRSIAAAAAEQSGRVFVPEVDLFVGKLEDLIDQLKEDKDNLYYLDFRGTYLNTQNTKANLTFFIGPEGGWSKNEKLVFESKGAEPIAISDNILRSETAGMTFLAQYSYISKKNEL